MRAIIDHLVGAIYSDTAFRKRVETFVLTAPNTRAASVAWTRVQEHPLMHHHGTRDHVHTAANIAHLRLSAARLALMQRVEATWAEESAS